MTLHKRIRLRRYRVLLLASVIVLAVGSLVACLALSTNDRADDSSGPAAQGDTNLDEAGPGHGALSAVSPPPVPEATRPGTPPSPTGASHAKLSGALSTSILEATLGPTLTHLPDQTCTPALVGTPFATSTASPSDTITPSQPPDADLPPNPTPRPSGTPILTSTSRPKPATAPKPTVVLWAWTERLVSVGEEGQYCGEGYLRIRVMALDPYGAQIPGVWVYDRYSKVYQVTGNVDAQGWGRGETMFNYGGDGGGALCIALGQGGPCLTDYTRDMPCFKPPPFEDMWAAGWCQCCGTEAVSDKELCLQMHERGDRCMNWGHYAWRVTYRRSW